jgi:hypothetical protein
MYDLVTITDPHGQYTLGQIVTLIEIAKGRGYPLGPGSYIEQMTVKQLARLMEERYDA